MSKFKVGDKVRALYDWGSSEEGGIYTIAECWYNHDHKRCYVRLEEHLSTSPHHSHTADMYERVEPNPVLTPEEVFKHLRKGTQLQLQNSHSGKWYDVIAPQYASYEEITTKQWRIKPEPEVIELNGKKYREIVE